MTLVQRLALVMAEADGFKTANYAYENYALADIPEFFKFAEEWANAPGRKDEWYPCDVSAVIAALEREAWEKP